MTEIEAFQQGLRELGYIEGENILIEGRWAEGKYDRLAELAAQLAQLEVDVLVTSGTPGTRTAQADVPWWGSMDDADQPPTAHDGTHRRSAPRRSSAGDGGGLGVKPCGAAARAVVLV